MTTTAESTSRVIDCFAKNTLEVPEALAVVPFDSFADLEQGALADMLEFDDFPEDGNLQISMFSIMSQTDGDKRVVWSRRVIAQIKAAKEMFLDLIKQGMQPYRVGRDGGPAEKMIEFDPAAEEIIFMPIQAIAGG